MRVGEKEISEQAEIVRRYADLFSREQLEALREAEEAADGDERERLYRLRKTCEGGLISAELAEREDELENRLLARAGDVQGRGDAAAQRAGEARGAAGVRRPRGARRDPGRGERALQRRPARAGPRRRGARGRVLRDRRRGRAQRGGEGHLAARAVGGARAGERTTRRPRYGELRERWFERLLGADRAAMPSSYHTAYMRRLSPLESTYTEGSRDRDLPRDAAGARVRPRSRSRTSSSISTTGRRSRRVRA